MESFLLVFLNVSFTQVSEEQKTFQFNTIFQLLRLYKEAREKESRRKLKNKLCFFSVLFFHDMKCDNGKENGKKYLTSHNCFKCI